MKFSLQASTSFERLTRRRANLSLLAGAQSSAALPISKQRQIVCRLSMFGHRKLHLKQFDFVFQLTVIHLSPQGKKRKKRHLEQKKTPQKLREKMKLRWISDLACFPSPKHTSQLILSLYGSAIFFFIFRLLYFSSKNCDICFVYVKNSIMKAIKS